MKRILLSLFIVNLYVLNANAQNFNVYNNFQPTRKNAIFSEWLSRRITAQSTPLPWVQAVQVQVKKTHPQAGVLRCFMRDGIPAQIQPEVSPVVRERLDRWQKAHDENKALPRFFVKALSPKMDVAQFSEEQVAQVEHFLKTGYGSAIDSITPQRVQTFQRFLVGVILPPAAPGKARVHLLFNCFDNEVYVSYDLSNVPGVPVKM